MHPGFVFHSKSFVPIPVAVHVAIKILRLLFGLGGATAMMVPFCKSIRTCARNCSSAKRRRSSSRIRCFSSSDNSSAIRHVTKPNFSRLAI